jgi:hypothetical protein
MSEQQAGDFSGRNWSESKQITQQAIQRNKELASKATKVEIVNLCSVCQRKFPSQFILDLHFEEGHSPFFLRKLLAQEPRLYRCLEPDCPELFDNPKLRKQHWLQVHRIDDNQPLPEFYLHNRKRKKRQAKKKVGEDPMDTDSSFEVRFGNPKVTRWERG